MRSVTSNESEGALTVFIESDIDHHNATGIREEIDALIVSSRPRELTLDFQSVDFMDSSGIGLMLGRYKLIKSYGGSMAVENLNRRCERIAAMSGVFSFIRNKGEVDIT